MTGDQIASIIYLVLLGTAVGGWFLVSSRDQMNKTLQHAAIWGLIFVGVIAGYGLWGDLGPTRFAAQSVGEDGAISVPRSRDGHYYLTLDINEEPITFVVDTGATEMVLTQTDAERVGIAPETLMFLGSANTANGIVRTAPVTLDRVELAGIPDYDVRAWVNEGEMRESLLGMGYLQRFSRIEIAGDRLMLER
ncbi:TIGR02281 family clan AA aspartic protease [Aestuariibius insulae]|uniref:retropepsin-like aspartic protease family protein n=1 Tax=Aestuariibius insulae TaxID=2058287 RepID=UPI00345E10AB